MREAQGRWRERVARLGVGVRGVGWPGSLQQEEEELGVERLGGRFGLVVGQEEERERQLRSLSPVGAVGARLNPLG